MSQRNVGVIRQGLHAWLRGDIDAFLSSLDPEIVWDLTHFREWPESDYRGIEAVSRFLDEWLEVWDDYEMRVDEILEAPDGRVVTLVWQRGTGHKSGLGMEMEWAQIGTVRDGKIARIDNYDDRSQALRAAGLGE